MKWRRGVGPRGSGGVWSLHSPISTAPHNGIDHPENSLNPNTYAVQVSIKRLMEGIIGHWSESQCPSLFCEVRNYKPSFSSLSVEYSISSVGNSSGVWLSNCIPEIITWPMKESKFQEFQEAWSVKQEKEQTWIRKYQSKDNKKRAWRLSLYCISLAPTGYPTRAMFLAFSAAAPHVAQIFWLLLIIQE